MPVSAALEDEGYLVTQASDGNAAIAACRRSAPDVIVLDLALPHLDGAGFADEYRKLPVARAPIIVVSGTPRAAETAARVRASVFLSKPFSLRELLKEVRRLVDVDA